ncbi:hypothetical protein, partial [Brevibacillus sp. SIMBA_040]|uniref:hypothetical protein n=1 Tax=Brevibacillus sp. SIMBA_040 TaxID=3085781 RepID=UPI00397BCB5B
TTDSTVGDASCEYNLWILHEQDRIPVDIVSVTARGFVNHRSDKAKQTAVMPVTQYKRATIYFPKVAKYAHIL